MKPAIVFVSLVAFTILGFALFAFGTIAVQNQHAITEKHSLSVASSAQRDSRGNSAMIFASCQMRKHDLILENNKWYTLTRIERSFKRKFKSSADIAYHTARIKVLNAARAADEANLNLDCAAVMRTAYGKAAGSSPPLVQDPKAVK